MKKVTLTIGIPAHNEEKNIGKLLAALSKQSQTSYRLSKIIVLCDGCTDSTFEKIQKIAKQHSFIQGTNYTKRLGKAARLNQLYAKAKSDYLLTIDADVLPETNMEIEKMVQTAITFPNARVIGGRFIPLKQNTFMGKLSEISYKSYEDSAMRINNGRNIHTLVGGASLLKTSFAKTFTYPANTISDQHYLYFMATKGNKNGYQFVKEARFFIRTVDTFEDWKTLGVRSLIADKENVKKFLGKNVLKNQEIPKSKFVISLIKWFFKSPIYTTGSVVMNAYIRLFPHLDHKPKNGIWKLTQSSKKLINSII